MKIHLFIVFMLSTLMLTVSANDGNAINTGWQSLQATDASTAPSNRVMRDPFSDPQISYSGQQSSFTQGSNAGFGAGFQRGRGDFKVPELIFKGYIESTDSDEPMALIQIGKDKVHMVREGDEINIDPTQPRNAIRITKINRLSITVETGILGTMRVLR